MQKWDYCAIYQISQMVGWLTGVGMVYRGSFTVKGAEREELEHDPNALARGIAKLGLEGWEMVGAAVVSEYYHTLYFKRPVEE
jgi:hypothetical protein